MFTTYMRAAQSLIICFLISFSFAAAQEKPEKWDLISTINYALENNIQIQKSKVNLDQSIINTKQAKAQMLPSLSASIGQNLTNRPWLLDGSQQPANVYNGSYSISSSVTLFNGGRMLKNLQQSRLQEEASLYTLLEVEKNIEMSILRVYMQILYAKEAVNVYKEVIEAAEYQLTRGKALLTAGTVSRVDVAQLEAQLSSDKYQLIAAQNTLDFAYLQLKQLLELEIEEEISVVVPDLDDRDILKPLPELYDIYYTSLDVMPQMKSSQINIDIAALETSKARAGYLPRVSLSASIGSSNTSGTGRTFAEQLQNNFSDAVGITVNIPIFTNRENKSAVERAQLSERTAELDYIDTQKQLLQEVEAAYQDAVSSQNQYIAASENVEALEISYNLIQQQYNLGMKNTLELLTEKNNLLSAQQNLLQAKYISVMNSQILNLYQGLPLELK